MIIIQAKLKNFKTKQKSLKFYQAVLTNISTATIHNNILTTTIGNDIGLIKKVSSVSSIMNRYRYNDQIKYLVFQGACWEEFHCVA